MEPNVSILKHFNWTCKLCFCSYSGENTEILLNHINECSHSTVTCSNGQCGHRAERRFMKDHSAICSLAIISCSNDRCKVTTYRKEMFSHKKTCPFKIVICENKFIGCDKSIELMNLEKHRKTCRFYCCAICNEYLLFGEQDGHICTLETIESPYPNKKESLRMPDKRHHEHPTVNLKCKFCEYRNVCRSEVCLHMTTCKNNQRKCLLCGEKVLLTAWGEHRLSDCNTKVRCTDCKLYIEK